MLELQPQAVLQGVLTAGLSGNLLFAETDSAVLEVHTESVHDCLIVDIRWFPFAKCRSTRPTDIAGLPLSIGISSSIHVVCACNDGAVQ